LADATDFALDCWTWEAWISRLFVHFYEGLSGHVLTLARTQEGSDRPCRSHHAEGLGAPPGASHPAPCPCRHSDRRQAPSPAALGSAAAFSRLLPMARPATPAR